MNEKTMAERLAEKVRSGEIQNPLPSPSSSNPLPSGDPTSSDAAHLDQAFAAATGASEPAGPRFMPRDEWCKGWLAAHGVCGQMLGSATLAHCPERAGAMDAAGAIYDTAADTPMLHWLIDPKSEWMKRGFVVFAFYGPVAKGVAGELRQRRAAKPAGKASPAPGVPDMSAAPEARVVGIDDGQ